MALSTNRTLITQTGINTHQVLNVGGLDSAGIATFSNFKTGTTNVHNIGIEAAGINVLGADTPIGTGATIYDDGGARFSGIVSATSFVGDITGDITGGGTFTGDISQATGAAAGLGTALSQTQTDPLNKVYYTDKVLSISTTTTIDHPATANLAYTQYGDIKIEDGHDLIIKDGDDFKYDILGISTTKTFDIVGNVTGDVTGNLTGNVTGNINNTPLLLQTKGTERLRISPEGYVTKPYQPSFSAWISNSHVAASKNTGTQTIPFDSVHTNIGSHFKTSGVDAHKFVAPVAGNYFFALSQNHNSRVDSKILKNGVVFHEGENEIPVSETGGQWHHHTLTCIIPLAAGDKVHCTTRNDDGDPYRAWNTAKWDNFSGFLIG